MSSANLLARNGSIRGGIVQEPALEDLGNDVGYRLYNTPKEKEKSVDGDEIESAAIVSDLSSTTLRWMKKRRNPNAEQKLVISFQREQQLRQMFKHLDYDGKGAIDLEELTKAVVYVQEKTKGSKGLEQFRNIQQVFVDMDDNGDGTVDFGEFLVAMTGTTQSTFDKATAYDTERLFNYFIEYGEYRAREIAWKRIEESLQAPAAPAAASVTEEAVDNSKSEKKDSASFQHFKSLFGAEESSKASAKTISRTSSVEFGIRQSAQVDKILQEFITESQKLSGTLGSTSNEEYNALQEKMRSERLLQIQQQATAVAEAGVASAFKRDQSLLKKSLIKAQGAEVADSSSSSSFSPSKNVAKNPTMIPADQSLKRNLELRDIARKEAFDILHAPKEQPPQQLQRNPPPVSRSSFAGFGQSLLNIPEQHAISRVQDLRAQAEKTPPLSGRERTSGTAETSSALSLPRIKAGTSASSRRAQLTRASIQF